MGFDFSNTIESNKAASFDILNEITYLINFKNNIGKAYYNAYAKNLYWSISETDNTLDIFSFIKENKLIHKLKNKIQTNILLAISEIKIENFLRDIGGKYILDIYSLLNTIKFLCDTYFDEYPLTKFISITFNSHTSIFPKWDEHDWFIWCDCMDKIGQIIHTTKNNNPSKFNKSDFMLISTYDILF